jgi:phosphonate transport system substrate-binding protein
MKTNIGKHIIALALLALALLSFGCGSAPRDYINLVWYPNESGEDKRETRIELERIIAEASGREVRSTLTTDYTVAIEAIVNGAADIAFMGAQGYVEAQRKNPAIVPLVTHTGPSGTLADAVYYSWMAVRSEDAESYRDGQGIFSLDQLEGKSFAFVSVNSTSGTKIPAAVIAEHFRKRPDHAELGASDLIQRGGAGILQQVLFSGTHIGGMMNLLMDKADVVALASSQLLAQMELVEGEQNKADARYLIRKDAKEPLKRFGGRSVTLIHSSPVLNEPFAVNTDTVAPEQVAAIQAALTSDAVSANPLIFTPPEGGRMGIFKKRGAECFVIVEDDWYDPIRDLTLGVGK